MSGLLEQVMGLPTLPEFVAELDSRLADERARRQRFYAEVPDGAKWEFINGEVTMHSPGMGRHLAVRGRLERLLSAFVDAGRLGVVLGEKALCVFPRNDFMPDVVFFGPEKAARLEPRHLRLPVPDFVCEVLSESTTRRDRGLKFQDYAAHGVAEYWLLDPDAEELEQFLLQEGAYRLAMKSGTGYIRSHAVAGFEIPVRALFDPAENIAALRTLLLPHDPP